MCYRRGRSLSTAFHHVIIIREVLSYNDVMVPLSQRSPNLFDALDGKDNTSVRYAMHTPRAMSHCCHVTDQITVEVHRLPHKLNHWIWEWYLMSTWNAFAHHKDMSNSHVPSTKLDAFEIVWTNNLPWFSLMHLLPHALIVQTPSSPTYLNATQINCNPEHFC